MLYETGTKDNDYIMVYLPVATNVWRELADLDAWTLSLLTNTEVNEMHRTLEGQRQEYRDDEWIVWSGENKESTYIAIFNVSDEKKEIPGKLTERYLRKDAKEIWSGKR